MSDNSYQPKIYRKQGGDDLVIANGGKIYAEGSDADAGLSAFWDDCPRLQMAIDPLLGHFCFDDFTKAKGTTFTTANDYTLAGANGTFTHLAGDPNGVAVLTCPGADNDECNVNLNSGVGLIKMDAAHNWWFESRVKLSQIAAEQGVFVGLVDDQVTVGVDFMNDNDMVMKVQGVLGFQIIHAAAAAAQWQTMHIKAAGARVAVNATAKLGSTDWMKLGMKCIDNVITFYADGAAIANTITSAATNYPLDLYGMPTFATKTGKAAANTLSVDWWAAAQLR